MSLILRLMNDLNRLMPYYREPQILDMLGLSRHNHWRHNNLFYEVFQHLPSTAIPKIGKDGFQVSMDVSEFKPSELDVKVVDNSIVVEGKHKEREEGHGFISRHFVRRYALPKNYDPDKVQSTLSSDGVLTVSVPKPQLEGNKSNERHIQIQQTGPAHLNIKENAPEEKSKEKD